MLLDAEWMQATTEGGSVSLSREAHEAIMSASLSIIDAWSEWDAEARNAAQIEQDDQAWIDVMRSHVYGCLSCNLSPLLSSKDRL